MKIFEAMRAKDRAGPAAVYAVADLEVDLSRRTVRRRGEIVRLPDLSFDLLARLARAAPEPVGLADLARDVWQLSHVSEETVAKRTALLRQALGDDFRSPRYIRTVRGAGYALAGPVALIRQKGNWLGVATLRAAALVAMLPASAAAFLAFLNPDGGLAGAALPSTADILVARAHEQLAVHQAAETEQAIELASRALKLDPHSDAARIAASFAYATRATKFRERNDDGPRAERLARAVLAGNKGRSRAWHALGYALDAQGRVDEALAAYQRAYQLDPGNGPAMSSAAYLLSIRGRLFDALKLEARALRTGRSSRYADVQIARILELVGHPSAPAWRRRALASGPGNAVVIAEAARSRLRAGDADRALALLRHGAQEQNSPRLLRLRGRAHLARGERQAALRAFRRAGTAAALDLAALEGHADDGRAADFHRGARRAMAAGDTWPEWRVRMAEYCAALGDHEGAVAFLSQAVGLGWRDAALLDVSPFLFPLRRSDAWRELNATIRRQLAIQRELIDGDPDLRALLSAAG